MAHLARLSSLTDELVTSLTGLQPRRNPKEFKQAKEIASKGLRPHQYGRVNQFDVQTRLEGLEEKFIVLDREDLAKAFKVRLDEFARIPNKFSPEFLALLLELVDNPIANSSVKALELCRPPPPEPELTWDDIVADDPLNEEGLWDDIDYGVASSEDEFDDIPITPKSSARTRRNQASEVDEDLVVIEDVTYPMDEEILQDIQKAQFWRERVPGVKGTTTHEVSELQVIREVLFMLAGLPTSLFVTSGKSISFNRNHSVNHAQLETLDNVLQHFAVIGSTLLAVRQWTSRTQTISLLQTFQAAIQHQITAVDIGLSNLQKYYLEPNRGVIASLLEIQDKVHDLTDTLIRLADLALTKSHGTAPFFYLEALFDEIDLSLLAGEAKIFRRLGDVFFQCFQTYLKPMRRWTEDGELDLHNETFFIGKTTTERQQHETSLWHDRFELRRDESGSLFAPRFLHPAAKAILNAGKSIVFLKELGLHDESATKLVEPVLDFATVCPQSTELPLTPFSELFYAAFNDWIGSKHSHAASILREQLYSRCGLWSFLDALDIVYLSEDGSMLQNLADAVFAKIDRNSSKWNDRFLLTELAQIAFGEARSVEADRIAARSRKVQKHGRTVKDLSSFSLDYQVLHADLCLSFVITHITTDFMAFTQHYSKVLHTSLPTSVLFHTSNLSIKVFASTNHNEGSRRIPTSCRNRIISPPTPALVHRYPPFILIGHGHSSPERGSSQISSGGG